MTDLHMTLRKGMWIAGWLFLWGANFVGATADEKRDVVWLGGLICFGVAAIIEAIEVHVHG